MQSHLQLHRPAAQAQASFLKPAPRRGGNVTSSRVNRVPVAPARRSVLRVHAELERQARARDVSAASHHHTVSGRP
jgi:hypothetical protein